MNFLKRFFKSTLYAILGKMAELVSTKAEVLPAFSLRRKLPANISEDHMSYFRNELNKEFDPVVRVHAKNAYLIVDEGLVIKSFHILPESLMDEKMRNWYGFSSLIRPYFASVSLPQEKYLFTYNHYGVGYGHWLADVLPRLWILRKELKEYKLLLPEDYNTFHVHSLAPFGLSGDNVHYLKKGKSYKVPDITLVSHVGTTCNTKDEVLQELRDFYLDYYVGKSRPTPTRKLYISRSRMKNRKVVNEGEVEALLLKYGFEILYPEEYNFEQQVKLFSECKVLVGLTGSGLTNMLFMQERSSVVEFKMKEDYSNLHYFSMASGMQLDYYYLICEVQGEDRFTADFKVDLAGLEGVLATLQNE